MSSGGVREWQEVSIEGFGAGAVLVIAGDKVTYDFPGSTDLAKAMVAPARVIHGQVEELEGALKRIPGALLITGLLRSGGACHLGADVAQLLHQRHLGPAAVGEIQVTHDDGHGLTNRSMTAATRARIAGSSTDRVRFPSRGGRLIIESYSSQAGVPNSAG